MTISISHKINIFIFMPSNETSSGYRKFVILCHEDVNVKENYILIFDGKNQTINSEKIVFHDLA